jgi:hypothetical protein
MVSLTNRRYLLYRKTFDFPPLKMQFFCTVEASSRSAERLVKVEADRLFLQGRFKEALDKYSEAIVTNDLTFVTRIFLLTITTIPKFYFAGNKQQGAEVLSQSRILLRLLHSATVGGSRLRESGTAEPEQCQIAISLRTTAVSNEEIQRSKRASREGYIRIF